MALPATAAFTTAGALDASFTNVETGTISQSGGNALGSAALTHSAAVWNADAFTSDHYAQVAVIGVSSLASYVGPTCRMSGTRAGGNLNMYVWGTDGGSGANHTSLTVCTAGTYNAVQNVATTFATNDVGRLECQGGNQRMYKNGVQVGTTAADATIGSGGSGGLWLFGTSTADNWEAGDIIAGQPAAKRMGGVGYNYASVGSFAGVRRW